VQKYEIFSLNECKKTTFSRKYLLIDAFIVLKVDKTTRQIVRLTIFAPIFATVKNKVGNIGQVINRNSNKKAERI